MSASPAFERPSGGSYAPPRRGSPYSPPASVRAVDEFDLRTTRDLSSRRLWREWMRAIVRVSVAATGDVAFGAAAALAVFTLMGVEMATALAWTPRFLVMVLFGQAAAHTYAPGRSRVDADAVLKGAVAAIGARWAIDSVYEIMVVPFVGYLVLAAATALALVMWRTLLGLGVRQAYAAGWARSNALIVADRDQAWDVLERFRTGSEGRVKVMGHVAPQPNTDPTAIGTIEEIGRLIEEQDIDSVVISAHLDADRFQEMVRTCFLHGVSVSVIPSTLAETPCRVSSRELLGWPLLELEPPRLHMAQVWTKRAIDITLSAFLLAVLAPLFVLLAIAIRLDSRGPIFFQQWRPGLAGRRFPMLKFRSMRPDAEALLKADPVLYQKFLDNDCKLPADEDPRISRLGRVLRASSLDELPQLINVLKGDMSLIGPRPVVGPELTHYGEWAPVVLAVRPGMTGYWQVAGRSSIMFPERAHLDIYYVTRWSLGLDLRILVLTLPAVLRRSGAF